MVCVRRVRECTVPAFPERRKFFRLTCLILSPGEELEMCACGMVECNMQAAGRSKTGKGTRHIQVGRCGRNRGKGKGNAVGHGRAGMGWKPAW